MLIWRLWNDKNLPACHRGSYLGITENHVGLRQAEGLFWVRESGFPL